MKLPHTKDNDELADAIRKLAETPEELKKAREQQSDWANNELQNYED